MQREDVEISAWERTKKNGQNSPAQQRGKSCTRNGTSTVPWLARNRFMRADVVVQWARLQQNKGGEHMLKMPRSQHEIEKSRMGRMGRKRGEGLSKEGG